MNNVYNVQTTNGLKWVLLSLMMVISNQASASFLLQSLKVFEGSAGVISPDGTKIATFYEKLSYQEARHGRSILGQLKIVINDLITNRTACLDVATYQQRPGENSFLSVAWSPNSECLVTACDIRDAYSSKSVHSQVTVWDINMGSGNCSIVCTFPMDAAGVSAVSWSPDGQKIALGFLTGKVSICNVYAGGICEKSFNEDLCEKGKAKSILPGEQVKSVLWSADNKEIFTLMGDDQQWDRNGFFIRSFECWNVATGEKTFDRGLRMPAEASKFDLSLRSRKYICVLDATMKQINVLHVEQGHGMFNINTDSNVMCVAISSDGTKIVAGLEDQSFGIWDIATGNKLKTLPNCQPRSKICLIHWSSDDKKIITSYYDQSIEVLDLTTLAPELFTTPVQAVLQTVLPSSLVSAATGFVQNLFTPTVPASSVPTIQSGNTLAPMSKAARISQVPAQASQPIVAAEPNFLLQIDDENVIQKESNEIIQSVSDVNKALQRLETANKAANGKVMIRDTDVALVQDMCKRLQDLFFELERKKAQSKKKEDTAFLLPYNEKEDK